MKKFGMLAVCAAVALIGLQAAEAQQIQKLNPKQPQANPKHAPASQLYRCIAWNEKYNEQLKSLKKAPASYKGKPAADVFAAKKDAVDQCQYAVGTNLPGCPVPQQFLPTTLPDFCVCKSQCAQVF